MNLIRTKYIDILFGIVIPLIIVIILLYPIYKGSGLIYYGDSSWNYFGSIEYNLATVYYAWYSGPTNPYSFFYILIESIFLPLGNYFANRVFIVFMAMLPGSICYYSITKYIGLALNTDLKTSQKFVALIGSTFYLVNWQNFGLIFPLLTWSISYSMQPLFVYFIFKIVKERKKIDVLLFAALTPIADIIPTWVIFFPLIFLFVFLFDTIKYKNTKKALKYNSYYFFLTISAILVFNIFVILPTLYAFSAGQLSGVYSTYGNLSQEIAVAKSISYFRLVDVVMYGEPTYYSFGIFPQNWTFLNIFIPLTPIVLLFYLFYGRYRTLDSGLGIYRYSTISSYSLSLIGILSISLFLSKGFNPPFGFLYGYLIRFSFFGVSGLTRDVGVYLQLVSICYTYIIATILLFILEDCSKIALSWKSPRDSFLKNLRIIVKRISLNKKRDIRNLLKSTLSVVAFLIVIGALVADVNSTSISLKSVTYDKYNSTCYPSYYNTAIEKITSISPNAYVIWFPQFGNFNWKNNGSSVINWGPNLYKNSVSSSNVLNYLFDSNTDTCLGELMSTEGAKFLVYQSDAIIMYNGAILSIQTVLERLSNQSDINLVGVYGELYLYQNIGNTSQLQVMIPTVNNPYSSLLNVDHYVPYSNLYTNSSSLLYTLLCAGELNYTSEYKSNEYHSFDNYVSIRHGQQAFIVTRSYSSYIGYNNTDFKMLNITSSQNRYNITIEYRVPSFLKEYTTLYSQNGTFDNFFGGVLDVFPLKENLGKTWFDQILYSDPSYNQLNHNATAGRVSFNIPSMNNVSLFFYFYGASFSLISPLEYIGSFINNHFSTIPFFSYNSTKNQPIFKTVSGPSNFSIQPTLNVINLTLKNNSLSYTAKYSTFYVFVGTHLVKQTVINEMNRTSNIFVVLKSIMKGAVETAFTNGTVVFHFNSANYTLISGDTPFVGTYQMSVLLLNGSARLNNHSLTFSPYKFQVNITSGQVCFNLTGISGNTKIEFLLEKKNIESSPFITSCSEVNPTFYEAHLNTTYDSLLILAQLYSVHWVLLSKNFVIHPIPINDGAVTGFLVPAGNYTIRIEYNIQIINDIGFFFLSLEYLFLFFIILWSRIKLYVKH